MYDHLSKLGCWIWQQMYNQSGLSESKISEQVHREKLPYKPEQVFCEPINRLHSEQWKKQNLHASIHSFRSEKLHRHHTAAVLE